MEAVDGGAVGTGDGVGVGDIEPTGAGLLGPFVGPVMIVGGATGADDVAMGDAIVGGAVLGGVGPTVAPP